MSIVDVNSTFRLFLRGHVDKLSLRLNKSEMFCPPAPLCFRGSVLGEERVVGIFAVHAENGALPCLAVDISTLPTIQQI